MSGFFKSSIGRKVAMSLSAFFLMIFLLIHVSVNLLSVFSVETFNIASHFMGTNLLVQFFMQPILIFGVVFHFVMGFVLEVKNKKALGVPYVRNNGAANSTWASRNMIYSGLVILAFLVLHFIDFWIPELNTKYVLGDMSGMQNGEFRYFAELHHKFESPLRVGAYVVAFVLLGLHLAHGFTSAFQSMGITVAMGITVGKKKALKSIGKAYAIIIPAVFIFIALYHHFNH